MPDDSATFDTTSGFATVSGTNIVVTIPSGTVAGNYYVKIKATFTNPPQNPTQEVYMKIQDRLTGSAPIVYGSESGATTAAKITSSVPVNYEVTDYDGLSAQKFSIDSTGNISLNVGEGDKGNYTVKVKLTAKDNATNIKLLDISVVVKSAGGFTSLPSAGYITEVGE